MGTSIANKIKNFDMPIIGAKAKADRAEAARKEQEAVEVKIAQARQAHQQLIQSTESAWVAFTGKQQFIVILPTQLQALLDASTESVKDSKNLDDIQVNVTLLENTLNLLKPIDSKFPNQGITRHNLETYSKQAAADLSSCKYAPLKKVLGLFLAVVGMLAVAAGIYLTVQTGAVLASPASALIVSGAALTGFGGSLFARKAPAISKPTAIAAQDFADHLESLPKAGSGK